MRVWPFGRVSILSMTRTTAAGRIGEWITVLTKRGNKNGREGGRRREMRSSPDSWRQSVDSCPMTGDWTCDPASCGSWFLRKAPQLGGEPISTLVLSLGRGATVMRNVVTLGRSHLERSVRLMQGGLYIWRRKSDGSSKFSHVITSTQQEEGWDGMFPEPSCLHHAWATSHSLAAFPTNSWQQ